MNDAVQSFTMYYQHQILVLVFPLPHPNKHQQTSGVIQTRWLTAWLVTNHLCSVGSPAR